MTATNDLHDEHSTTAGATPDSSSPRTGRHATQARDVLHLVSDVDLPGEFKSRLLAALFSSEVEPAR